MVKPDRFDQIACRNTEEKEHAYRDAIEYLYGFEPFLFVTQPLFSAVLCWGLWAFVDHTQLIVWQVGITLLSLVRYFFYHLYFKSNLAYSTLSWGYFHTGHSLVLGLLWAYASYIFLGQNTPSADILWLVALLGSFVLAVPFLSYCYLSFLAYILPTALTLPVVLFFYGTPYYQALSLLIAVHCLLILFIAYRTHLSVFDNIRLRLQKTDLVKQLEKEQAHAASSDQAQSTFLASALHDLRQPLHALNLYLDALGLRLNNKGQYELLGKLQQSERALSHLLRTLFNVSNLETSNSALEKQAISSPDVIPSNTITAKASPMTEESLSSTTSDRPILLIEDQDDVLQATTTLLEYWGYTVVTAHDLTEAMVKIKTDSVYPVAIISDYRLSPSQKVTGIEVIQSLHSFYKEKIPAVIITGDTSLERLTSFKAANIPVLHKPIQIARLRTFLQRAIHSSPSK